MKCLSIRPVLKFNVIHDGNHCGGNGRDARNGKITKDGDDSFGDGVENDNCLTLFGGEESCEMIIVLIII